METRRDGNGNAWTIERRTDAQGTVYVATLKNSNPRMAYSFGQVEYARNWVEKIAATHEVITLIEEN